MLRVTRSTEFACCVRNHTENALRLEIPFGALEMAPKMTEGEHKEVVAHCRTRFDVGDRGKSSDQNLAQAESTPTPERDEEAAQRAQEPVASNEKKGSPQSKPKPAPRPEPDEWRS
jgi:hypothetical protein